MRHKELYNILDGYPRFVLLAGRTPLEKLHRLSAELPVELYIKRDDLTGIAAGGNKNRKLEYLIGLAREEGADTLLTAGWYHSNHALQTAGAAGRADMKAILFLKGKACYRGSLYLDRLAGADIRFYDAPSSSALMPYMVEAAEALKKEGKKPFIIPVGGSNKTGALGYVRTAAEIAAQCEEQGLNLDYIVCPTSSGGTQAGLTLGVRECLPRTKVLAIGVGDDREEVLTNVYNLLQDLSVLLQRKSWDRDMLACATVTDYGFGAYGKLDPKVTELIRYLGAREGIFLDPVYTGKAFFGMMDLIRTGQIPSESHVCFVHTGGLSSLFQYEEELNAHLDALR